MTVDSATDAAPLYEYSSQMLGWTIDESRMSSMRSANEAQLSELEVSIKDAEENLGDIEVRDAFLAKADYLYKIGVLSSQLLSSSAFLTICGLGSTLVRFQLCNILGTTGVG